MHRISYIPSEILEQDILFNVVANVSHNREMARLNLLELENGLENGFGLTNSQLHLIYNLLHYAEKRCISTTKISSLP